MKTGMQRRPCLRILFFPTILSFFYLHIVRLLISIIIM